MDDLRQQKHGQIDGTYKLITDNFVVIPFCYADRQRHFHPTGISIVSSESKQTYSWIFNFLKSNKFYDDEWIPEEFLSDNARSITAAIHDVFPETIRRNCFTHLIMKVDLKLRELGIDDQMKAKIKDDIYHMASASSLEHFLVLSEHYLEEWVDTENSAMIDFSTYFRKQYVQRGKYWFGKSGSGIRSNNDIEGSNRWLKIDFITRRAPLTKAINLLKKWVLKARDKNYGSPEIAVTGAQLVHAYDFKKKTKINFNEGIGYLLRRSKSQLSDVEFTSLLQKVYAETPATTTDILQFQANAVIVSQSKLYPQTWTCNCYIGCKREYCKHIIVVAARNGEFTFDNIEAQRQRLSTAARNLPGRPKKFTKALVRD